MEEIKLKIETDKEGDDRCRLHTVKVNDVSLTILQHAGGWVTLNIHGMKEDNCEINIHGQEVTKKFVNKRHTWSTIRVVE